MTARITVFDTTLRDGEQSPGCSMHTGEKVRMALQLERLGALGLSVGLLPEISDIDSFEDARRVAAEYPDGEFASAVRRMETNLCPS